MISRIITELPGPRAQAVIEKDNRFMSPSYTRPYPFVMEKGEGALVYDADGNRFLDFAAGIAVCSTGHAHPEVVQAIKEQAQKFLHMSGTDFYYEVQVELAEKLANAAPIKGSGENKLFFTNSGAEAVEAALKLARYKTRRTHLIAYYGSFHGRTMGALSLTSSKVAQRKGFGPLLPGVTHIFYPYCYRCPLNLKYDSCDIACLKYVEDIVFAKKIDPEDVAAVFIEPIQGEGGYVVPPKEYLTRLRKLCDKWGILLVADEVQTGMGRTGKLFASEHFQLKPDIICLAKGIASGLPLGAIIADKDTMCWGYGSHATTFGGNPVCCAAARKTLELLERELLENVRQLGHYLMDRLKPFVEKYEIVGDVRGLGLMIGIEIVKEKKGRQPAPEIREEILKHCFGKGLLLLGCGPNALRIAPPLLIAKEQADFALQCMEESMAELSHQ